MRLYPRDRSRHAVRLLAGRLHAQLLVLPYRHAAAGAQPDAGRDRRPGRAGARPAPPPAPRSPARAGARRGGRGARARARPADWQPPAAPAGTAPEKRLVSNVVLMGRGEPLYNFEA